MSQMLVTVQLLIEFNCRVWSDAPETHERFTITIPHVPKRDVVKLTSAVMLDYIRYDEKGKQDFDEAISLMEGGLYTLNRDSITINSIYERYSYSAESIQHKHVYPALEDIGDKARICILCGHNGDI